MSTYTKWIFKYGSTFHKSRQWWCGVFVFQFPFPPGCWMISGQLRGFPCWVPQVLTILSSADVTTMSPQRNTMQPGGRANTYMALNHRISSSREEYDLLGCDTVNSDTSSLTLPREVGKRSFISLLVSYLLWLILWPWRWRRNILPKRRWAFTELHFRRYSFL
jgi:hypothetical protein